MSETHKLHEAISHSPRLEFQIEGQTCARIVAHAHEEIFLRNS